MTLAVALLVVFARLVALIVCVPNACGGLYNPELEMVPTVLLPLATPSTLQRTDLLVVLVTVAVNCCVWVKVSPAVLGRTVTETCAAALEHRLNVKRVRSRILFHRESHRAHTSDWKSLPYVRLAVHGAFRHNSLIFSRFGTEACEIKNLLPSTKYSLHTVHMATSWGLL